MAVQGVGNGMEYTPFPTHVLPKNELLLCIATCMVSPASLLFTSKNDACILLVNVAQSFKVAVYAR